MDSATATEEACRTQAAKTADMVDAVIEQRRAIHSFLPKQVGETVVRDLLRIASRAPSGTNTQPWSIHAVSGDALKHLCDAMLAAHRDCPDDHDYGYKYYPDEMFGVYAQRQLGYWNSFWGIQGVPKSEKQRVWEIIARNYSFFGAPVALIFTIHAGLAVGSWFDYGMFAGNLMIAAKARGLDTCPQVSVAKYHKVIRQHLAIPDEHIVICGMALGHADPQAKVNTLAMGRDPVDQFANFVGFQHSAS